MRIPIIAKILLGACRVAGTAGPGETEAPKSTGAAALPDLATSLREVRHGLVLGAGGMRGDGADLIGAAIAEARFVAIGEDHFTREIPLFTSAICDLMGARSGLAAYVVEAGPIGAAQIAPMLDAPNRIAQVAAFARRYPNAVVFADGEDKNETAAHCRRTGGAGFRLIGVDQEFFGASGLLLDRILKQRLSAGARQAVAALRAEDRAANAAAAKTGDPGGLIMLSADARRIDAVEAALDRGGDAEARRLFGEFKISHDIYALDRAGSPSANEMRARLMKRHLASSLPARGKVLLKFGDWHIYKGVNPLGQRDIGNFIAERAEGEGGRSFHILVLAARGQHGQYRGYARQARAQSFTMSEDRDYRWFGLAADNQVAEGWTVFDLRPLRHRRMTGVDTDWRRVLDGYDLMVVIPQASAAKVIGYPIEP